MKKLCLIFVLLLTGTIAWSLNPRTVADRALRYLGASLPKEAKIDDFEGQKRGIIWTVEGKDYSERFTLLAEQDGIIHTCILSRLWYGQK